jgi:hypothetical protein
VRKTLRLSLRGRGSVLRRQRGVEVVPGAPRRSEPIRAWYSSPQAEALTLRDDCSIAGHGRAVAEPRPRRFFAEKPGSVEFELMVYVNAFQRGVWRALVDHRLLGDDFESCVSQRLEQP